MKKRNIICSALIIALSFSGLSSEAKLLKRKSQKDQQTTQVEHSAESATEEVQVKKDSLLFVVIAASGVGKDTVINEMLGKVDDLNKIVGVTTRGIRSNEKDGIDYQFIDKKAFIEYMEKDLFIETVNLYDNYYGLLSSDIASAIDKNNNMIINLNEEGAIHFKHTLSEQFPSIEVVFVYLLPPSIAEIEARLKKRGTETQQQIDRRMIEVGTHINSYKVADYVIKATAIQETTDNLISVYNTKKLELYKNNNLKTDVEKLMEEVEAIKARQAA